MVIRYGSEPDEVFLVESESANGVSIKRWSDYPDEPGTFYTKVVLRHLEWERPDESIDILEQFIEETQGAEYKFSLQYLQHR